MSDESTEAESDSQATDNADETSAASPTDEHGSSSNGHDEPATTTGDHADESAAVGEPEDPDDSNGSHNGGGPDDPDDPDGSDNPRDAIVDGDIAWPLFHLAWPIVVIQLLQVTYNIADTLYLGRLSAEAVGALSLAFPLIFLLIAVAAGFTTAGAILVAQYTGAEGEDSAGMVVGQTFSVVGALSVLIGIGGFFYTRPALELLPSDPDTSAEVVPLAADYMEIIFIGIPFLFGFFVFAALMRGWGDTRTPMYIMVGSVVLNILLDPFLIFGFENNPLMVWLNLGGVETTMYGLTGFTGFGIEGAALATVISRGFAAAIGMYLLFGTAVGPPVALHHLRPNLSFVKDIFRLGTPSMVEQSTSALAMIALIGIVVTFSPPVVAAYGLGNRIISLVFLPALGLGRAIDTMVGQNLGADRPDRAVRAVTLAASTGAGVMLAVAVVAVAFTDPIVSVFLGDVDNAPETIAHGVEYVQTRSIEFAFIGITQVMLGAFRGAGNTATAMVISIITLWVGRVGTVTTLVFVFDYGASGIWIGMAVGNILGAMVAVPWFLRGTWKEKYIDDPHDVDTSITSSETVVDGKED